MMGKQGCNRKSRDLRRRHQTKRSTKSGRTHLAVDGLGHQGHLNMRQRLESKAACVCACERASHPVADLLTLALGVVPAQTGVRDLALPVLVTEQATAVELNTTEEESVWRYKWKHKSGRTCSTGLNMSHQRERDSGLKREGPERPPKGPERPSPPSAAHQPCPSHLQRLCPEAPAH